MDGGMRARASGDESRSDGAAYEHPIRMDVDPVALALVVVAVAPEHAPGLLRGHQAHPLEDVIRNARAPVVEPLPFPGVGEGKDLFWIVECPHIVSLYFGRCSRPTL